MSSPGASQAIMRPDLRNAVAEEWNASGEAAMFTADLIANRVDVPNASGTIKRIPREAYTKDANSVSRGPDGSYPEVEWGDETLTYMTKEEGLAVPIDQNLAAQTKLYYDAERAATRIALSKLRRAHEAKVAAAVFNTSTFTGASLTTAITTDWRDEANATPIDDINGSRAKVRENCGRLPNSVIMPWVTWENLVQCEQILDRINGGATSDNPAIAQMLNVAKLFQVDRIIIAGGIKDTAKQGQAFVGGNIWNPDYVMVAYINPAAGLYDINLCNCYNWEGDGGSFDYTVERYYSEEKRREVVRARRQVGVKVEYPECGHLLTGANS